MRTDNYCCIAALFGEVAIMHNELGPFIDEVKLAFPPFWRSTLFVSIPFGITNTNAKKKCVKVCTKKNYTHIFNPSLDPNPRTSKMMDFWILVTKLMQPWSCVRDLTSD